MTKFIPRLQCSHFTVYVEVSPQNLQWCCKTSSTVISGWWITQPHPWQKSDLHLYLLEHCLPALDVSDEAEAFLLKKVWAAGKPASVLNPRVVSRLPVAQRSITAKAPNPVSMTSTLGKEKHLDYCCITNFTYLPMEVTSGYWKSKRYMIIVA